jgi:hypothetical protein
LPVIHISMVRLLRENMGSVADDMEHFIGGAVVASLVSGGHS